MCRGWHSSGQVSLPCAISFGPHSHWTEFAADLEQQVQMEDLGLGFHIHNSVAQLGLSFFPASFYWHPNSRQVLLTHEQAWIQVVVPSGPRLLFPGVPGCCSQWSQVVVPRGPRLLFPGVPGFNLESCTCLGLAFCFETKHLKKGTKAKRPLPEFALI